jgi:hypothetical protein
VGFAATGALRAWRRSEGNPGGISSGGAGRDLEVARREGIAGKRIVTIIPSFGERYITRRCSWGCELDQRRVDVGWCRAKRNPSRTTEHIDPRRTGLHDAWGFGER